MSRVINILVALVALVALAAFWVATPGLLLALAYGVSQLLSIWLKTPVIPLSLLAMTGAYIAALQALGVIVFRSMAMLGWAVRDGAGRKCTRLARTHSLYRQVALSASQMSIDCPMVYVSSQKTINAFVTRKRGQDRLVIHAGAMQTLDQGQMRWLIAHELSHLAHGDLIYMGWHQAIWRVAYLTDLIRVFAHRIVDATYRMFGILGVPLLPLLITLRLSAIVTRIASRLYAWATVQIDRHNEHAADGFAHDTAGAFNARSLFSRLGPAKASKTHPSMRSRKRRARRR